MILVFDTETTGKADFGLPANHPSQPRCVQLAVLLFDDTRQLRASGNFIIQPDGWTISPSAGAIHGITMEDAKRYGVPIKTALSLFSNLARKTRILSAFNTDFDRLILASEFYRIGYDPEPIMPTERLVCTMKAMTSVCRLPGSRGGYKWPKLEEAHRHLFQTWIENAHDALADTQAAARVLFWLLDNDPTLKQKFGDKPPGVPDIPGEQKQKHEEPTQPDTTGGS